MVLAIDIAIRNLKQVLRSPPQLALIVLFPLGFMGIFAFMFGAPDLGNQTSFLIAIVNQDEIEPGWKELFTSRVEPEVVLEHVFQLR